MGPLEGGTSGSLDAVGIPSEAGDLDLLVTVSYLDDFNQPQEVTQTLTVTVDEMPEMPDWNRRTPILPTRRRRRLWA
jgi:hypothetical protein